MKFEFWDFDDLTQTALRMLGRDIHDGYRSDFDTHTICTYQRMQTRKECRRQRRSVDLMVEITAWLGDMFDVELFCFEDTDSLGDWLAVHGFLDQEAA